MTNNKPRITAISAIEAIQTQMRKVFHVVIEAPWLPMCTSAAYEADE